MTGSLGNLQVGSYSYQLRAALPADLPGVVDLLAADQIGATRDSWAGDVTGYRRAFDAITQDPAQLLLVAVDPADGALVGTLQLTVIPGLARRGALRAQIEAVRVAVDRRGGGLGGAMIRWAVAEAGNRGCTLVQLTSDVRRADAHRFYERLGFTASHTGFKLDLRALNSHS